LNLAVAQAKSELARFRAELGLTTLHLFVKAPSVFAMLLGYRLNGLGELQLYDWSRPRTCLLRCSCEIAARWSA
jgi:hypothetical protein